MREREERRVRIRDDLRVELTGREVVVLDAASGCVHRLTGAAAAAIGAVLSGEEPHPDVADALRRAGILATDDGTMMEGGAAPDRRVVLMASALGVSTVLLPSALAAASTGGLSAGGSAYLDVTGMDGSSAAPTGQLQFVTYGATSGDRHLTPSADLDVEVLLVGGGGGGSYSGGGGGAGQVTRQILSLSGGQRYDVVVGTGGAGGTAKAVAPAGTASTFSRSGPPVVELLRAAGGGGGSYGDVLVAPTVLGAGGDSTAAGGANSGFGYPNAGGGGGGSDLPGADASGEDGGHGGAGVTVSDFVGADTTYGGGGGGGGTSSGGAGGAGGGGAGGAGGGAEAFSSAQGSAGSPGTGGGGGGGTPYADGGAGGSGLVMIRYYGARPQVNLSFELT